MKTVLNGMQTVTIEFLGVVFAVWLLFGCASWGLGRSDDDLAAIRTPERALVAYKVDFNRTLEKIPYMASR